MFFAAYDSAPVVIGAPEVGLVTLATLIIFAILGPRLLREIKAGKYS